MPKTVVGERGCGVAMFVCRVTVLDAVCAEVGLRKRLP